jgi:hypothetical protein
MNRLISWLTTQLARAQRHKSGIVRFASFLAFGPVLIGVLWGIPTVAYVLLLFLLKMAGVVSENVFAARVSIAIRIWVVSIIAGGDLGLVLICCLPIWKAKR